MPRQEVALQLKQLIAQYGTQLAEDPRRTDALLRDLCAPYKREVRALTSVAEEGLAKELVKDSGKTSAYILLPRLAGHLHDELGFDEGLASWAVTAWAEALGCVIPASDAVTPGIHTVKQARNDPEKSTKSTDVATDTRCTAKTRKGDQCKLKAEDGGLCRIHRAIIKEEQSGNRAIIEEDQSEGIASVRLNSKDKYILVVLMSAVVGAVMFFWTAFELAGGEDGRVFVLLGLMVVVVGAIGILYLFRILGLLWLIDKIPGIAQSGDGGRLVMVLLHFFSAFSFLWIVVVLWF